MSYRIAVCEDDVRESAQTVALLQKWAKQQDITIQLSTFSSAEDYLFLHNGSHPFDILLLDVEMQGISGIDLAKRIRVFDHYAEIIFVTSHIEFMGEGYEVDALHYLIKPLQQEKFFQVLNKAVEELAVEIPSIIVSCEGELVKLSENEILYVESSLHYVVIHTREMEYRIKENISSIAEKLSSRFCRIHRSYLVSLLYVVRISRTEVSLSDGTKLPLARSMYEVVNKAFIEQK